MSVARLWELLYPSLFFAGRAACRQYHLPFFAVRFAPAPPIGGTEAGSPKLPPAREAITAVLHLYFVFRFCARRAQKRNTDITVSTMLPQAKRHLNAALRKSSH